MKRAALVDLSLRNPEELLAVRGDAAPGVPIDAITVACERATAVLQMLAGQFSGDGGPSFADHVIAGVIWDVQGTIEQIKTLALYGSATSTPDASKGGGL